MKKEDFFIGFHLIGMVIWFFVKIPVFILQPLFSEQPGMSEVISGIIISAIISIIWELCFVVELIARFYLHFIIK